MTTLWAPSTAYALNALVLPRSAPAVVQEDLTNGDFEAGASGWTLGANWSITNGGGYSGTWKGTRSNVAGTSLATNSNEVPVAVGQALTVRAALLVVGVAASARIGIEWRDAAHAVLLREYSDLQVGGSLTWKPAVKASVAPASAAYAAYIVEGTASGAIGEIIRVDAATWDYAYVAIPNPLLFEATVAGVTGTAEPVWPTAIAGTVVDGTVTWTAHAATRVTWTAKPIMKSGAIEPAWPVVPGELVADGTISWLATTRRIEDERCPNTGVVTITASKVWAADGDIVRFCAINNPKDWQTADDAGFLPTGLHMNGNNECSALSVYRGNLAVASASTFQLWSVDEDPAANAMIDTMEGVGTSYPYAFTPVTTELFMLAALGVRSVGIAVASNNLANGDIGAPIDSLVKAALGSMGSFLPTGMYFPGAGQFWLVMRDEVFVYTINRTQNIGAWSRYDFPFQISGYAQLGDEMYVRDGNYVRLLTDSVNYDEMFLSEALGIQPVYFDSTIQWPWLDFGQPGQDKEMEGFDIVGTGTPTVQIGYDQRDVNAFTDEYTVAEDTLSDGMIAMPVTAPTLAVRVIYKGGPGNFWQLNAVNVHLVNA